MRHRHRQVVRSNGFTLIETALATVIIGVGVLAIVEAQQAFLRANAWSTHTATATYLANEIRELMRDMPKHDPVDGLYFDNGGALQGWGPDTGEVTVDDFDDIDDFDGLDSGGILLSWIGTTSLDDGDQPGPIDAFGFVIPEILSDGTASLDENGMPLALDGWTQFITVEKLDPFDMSVALNDNAIEAADGDFDGLEVDEFPLRVTVTVTYQGRWTTNASDIATISWIVP